MSVAQLERPSKANVADGGWLGRLVGAKTRFQTRRALFGYLFALPWILGLLIFWLGPILASLYYSFTEYDILSPAPKWVGLANYSKAFGTDEQFWPSLERTFRYSLIYAPTIVLGALLLASLLNQKLKANNFYRTIFFLPHLIPAVALAVLWGYLLQPKLGPVNQVLRSLGIAEPPNWLTARSSALNSILLINVWAGVGSTTMLTFLAALQGVPQEMYEAADMDGAGSWSKFRNVTLPLISPTLFLNVVLAVIASLKVFATAMVATQGGPSYATWFFALHIYNEAFKYYRMGYGSALAWVLAVVLMIFTFFQVRYSQRWVHYEGG